MRKLRSLYLLSTAAFLVAAFCFGSVVVSRAYLARRRAEQLLAMLKGIQVGRTSRVTALEMMRPFMGHGSETANGNSSQLAFAFDNDGLFFFRVAPYTEFRAMITFKNGIVVAKQAREFQPKSGCGAKVKEEIRGFGFAQGVAPEGYPSHVVHGEVPDFAGKTKRITVEDDNTYDETRRQADWSFDLSCMTQFRGCDDARMMLPNVNRTSISPGASGVGL